MVISTSHCTLAAAAAAETCVGEFSNIFFMITTVDTLFCLCFDFSGFTSRGPSLSTMRLTPTCLFGVDLNTYIRWLETGVLSDGGSLYCTSSLESWCAVFTVLLCIS